MKTNETRKQEIKTPFYKKAAFPWMIIYTILLLGTGVILGSVMTHNQEDQVKAEAASMVSTLKTPSR